MWCCRRFEKSARAFVRASQCVRRVGTTFHHDYKYFFKCLSGDPRFLFRKRGLRPLNIRFRCPSIFSFRDRSP